MLGQPLQKLKRLVLPILTLAMVIITALACAQQQPQASTYTPNNDNQNDANQDQLPVKLPNCWLAIKDNRTRW